MPYLHLDLPGTYPVEVKRELATRLCKLYADLMETQLWRPNVGFAELGQDNLYRLGPTALSPSSWSWSSFVAVARRNSAWLWVERSSTPASSCSTWPAERCWSSSRRMWGMRCSATETGLPTGPPTRR